MNTIYSVGCHLLRMIQLYTGLENLETMECSSDSCQAATDEFITISSIPAAGMRRSPHFSHFPTNPDSLLFKLYQIIYNFLVSINTPIPQRKITFPALCHFTVLCRPSGVFAVAPSEAKNVKKKTVVL